MKLPLEGIRVVDWTAYHVGPSATQMLGDLGAEVIKLEDTVSGDPYRSLKRLYGKEVTLKDGRPCVFEAINRNKKSVALDVTQEKAREAVYRLVEKSDVFVHNFRPGVAERLHLDYETLVQHNPRLIYAHASGYGLRGPDAGKGGVDPLMQGRTGFMKSNALPGSPPQFVTGGIADQSASIMLSYGVLAALYMRERTGLGQKMDCSLMGSFMWLQTMNMHLQLMLGMSPVGWDRTSVVNPLYNYYRCGDDVWIFLSLFSVGPTLWANFCSALGIEELENDPRFKDAVSRMRHKEEFIAVLEETFARKPSDYWVKALSQYPRILFDLVRDFKEIESDPQVIANEMITPFEHPVLGQVKYLKMPLRFNDVAPSIRQGAPEWDEHTEEVLTQICEYSWEEVAELREQREG